MVTESQRKRLKNSRGKMSYLEKLFKDVDNVIREAAKADSPIARAAIVKKGVKALDAEPIKVQFYDEKEEKIGRPVYLRD
jgi:hypothetical protein